MPSRNGTKQVWQSGSPSMSARHSWQAPAMQYGARRVPSTAARRIAPYPASSKALATLDPTGADAACPSTVKCTRAALGSSSRNKLLSARSHAASGGSTRRDGD